MSWTKTGFVLVAGLLALGMWILAAPFIVGYQTRGAGFSSATVTDIWTGGALIIAALHGLSVITVSGLRQLVRSGGDK